MRNETFVGQNVLKKGSEDYVLALVGLRFRLITGLAVSLIYLKSHVFLKALVGFVCIRFVKLT